jgi:hypothetical protein
VWVARGGRRLQRRFGGGSPIWAGSSPLEPNRRRRTMALAMPMLVLRATLFSTVGLAGVTSGVGLLVLQLIEVVLGFFSRQDEYLSVAH